MKVLLCEDEKRMNRALCEIMRQEGYDVTAVENGEDGLFELESGVYDLCVLDVMMPAMNGYEVAKKARAAGIRTPILMLTAKSELDDKVE
ncbi:MAG: response regulator, partial [Clostridia bacterium]|nr:response regulator [Clostridia bacterium]